MDREKKPLFEVQMSVLSNSLKNEAERLLTLADIQIGGNRSWDIKIHDDRFFKRVMRGGSLSFGESYIDGWWDVEHLDQFFTKLLSAKLDKKVRIGFRHLLLILSSLCFNQQSKTKAFEVGEKHYDIGNDLYQAMLDKRLVYTCAYWQGNPNAKNLDEAQEAKLDLVCRKLRLKEGQKILDIGCGWGSFAKYAAEKYGVKVVGITISKEQAELAKKLCQGYPVEILIQDYRDVSGQFDHVVSLGMFEHVGYKNYSSFMKVVAKILKDDGLFMLHTIGGNTSVRSTDPWISKYIFANSMLPSISQIGKSIENLFTVEDWHNFGANYDPTLMAWYHNVESNWQHLKKNYDERFHRMWKYYLLSCAASFRTRNNQLWQIVLSKNGVPGGYLSVR